VFVIPVRIRVLRLIVSIDGATMTGVLKEFHVSFVPPIPKSAIRIFADVKDD
jgi:hypothetical protein